jgi:hypothetical protein
MFARRHYRIIAAIIADLALSDDEHDDLGLIEIDALRESIARQFADGLAASNPNFNRAKVLAAGMAGTTKRVFDTRCPQCGKIGELVCCEAEPQVNCGDCLMDQAEVVPMVCRERGQ